MRARKPLLEKVNLSNIYSFNVEHITLPYFVSKWHYHHEHEIILMIRGKGTGFIGNGLTSFSPGTMAMIGAHTPHVWLCYQNYYQNNPDLMAEAIVIKFRGSFLGNTLIELPGAVRIKALFEKAKHGILFEGSEFDLIKEKLKNMPKLDDFDRILLLLEALNLFSKTTNSSIVSATLPGGLQNEKEFSKTDKILKFITSNFNRKITIEEVAEVANLSPTSFCRYFKSKTLKPFTLFVNEIRVEYAAKLLIETNRSVSEICYESGFNQLSNFYKQFADFKQMTPKQYRMKYWQFTERG
ncbi:MAG: AraC family transcriptional regulator [Prolixibacteraceae bacterium]